MSQSIIPQKTILKMVVDWNMVANYVEWNFVDHTTQMTVTLNIQTTTAQKNFDLNNSFNIYLFFCNIYNIFLFYYLLYFIKIVLRLR